MWNPGDKASEEKFKIINEANQALSDKTQRKKYDELRAQYLQWQQQGSRPQDISSSKAARSPLRRLAFSMPTPKIWKTCSDAIHRTPTFSPACLGAAKNRARGPAHAVAAMLRTQVLELQSQLRQLEAEQSV